MNKEDKTMKSRTNCVSALKSSARTPSSGEKQEIESSDDERKTATRKTRPFAARSVQESSMSKKLKPNATKSSVVKKSRSDLPKSNLESPCGSKKRQKDSTEKVKLPSSVPPISRSPSPTKIELSSKEKENNIPLRKRPSCKLPINIDPSPTKIELSNEKFDVPTTTKPVPLRKRPSSQLPLNIDPSPIKIELVNENIQGSKPSKPLRKQPSSVLPINIDPSPAKFEGAIENAYKNKEDEEHPANKIEESIRNILRQFDQNFVEVFKKEWEFVNASVVNDADCTAFSQNQQCNQDDTIVCLDINRVKLKSTPDYIHASNVEIKDISRKFILAQLPLVSIERYSDFWTMIHQQQINNIYLLSSLEESNKTEGEKFSGLFPIYYGATEEINECYWLEVMEKGDAIRVNLNVLNYWESGKTVKNRKKLLATILNLLAISEDEQHPIGIISKKGAGRAGTFLAILSAIHFMKNGTNF
ncbi:unnamed protein product [Caenorhabditis angaria]|uniref:Tyrosine-protein phosphatase domain-containing protein n=1 Tax=Caenorhabditis angaria TaxID=860376 RepID=A0A9P1IQI9_9PELO|nr:unnamed protein product [Caenorhabditis angaria]